MDIMAEPILTISEVIPAPGIPPEQAMRVLKVRGELIERAAAIELNQARNLRHQANIQRCQAKLQAGGADLPAWAELDLTGRIDESQAQIRKNHQKIELFKAEMTIYFVSLEQEDGPLHRGPGVLRKAIQWLLPMRSTSTSAT